MCVSDEDTITGAVIAFYSSFTACFPVSCRFRVREVPSAGTRPGARRARCL